MLNLALIGSYLHTRRDVTSLNFCGLSEALIGSYLHTRRDVTSLNFCGLSEVAPRTFVCDGFFQTVVHQWSWVQ